MRREIANDDDFFKADGIRHDETEYLMQYDNDYFVREFNELLIDFAAMRSTFVRAERSDRGRRDLRITMRKFMRRMKIFIDTELK